MPDDPAQFGGSDRRELFHRTGRLFADHGWAVLGLVVILAAGFMLRFMHGGDIEYKGDEAWTFEHSCTTRLTELPWVGMPASVHVPNPGMSLWVFVLLQRLTGAQNPPDLARGVQALNMAALLLLIAFACRHVRPAEREIWLWAAALAAVNPLAVLLQRKLWPPSVLPLGSVLFLWAWANRHQRVPAFLAGLTGICLGQIHMSGFFFAAGFALWALRSDPGRRPAWRSWGLGTALGALPMIPWAWHLAHLSQHPSLHGTPWKHMVESKFWLRWVCQALGFGADYTLEGNFADFLAGPCLGGHPTYLVGLLHGLLALVGLLILARAAWALGSSWRRWLYIGLGREGETGQAIGAAFWAVGLLLTLSGLSLHRHYMVVLFPLELVWLSRLALLPAQSRLQRRLGRALLGSLCVAQLLVSTQMLHYIHTHPWLQSEYGIPYEAQLSSQATKAEK